MAGSFRPLAIKGDSSAMQRRGKPFNYSNKVATAKVPPGRQAPTQAGARVRCPYAVLPMERHF